MKYGAILGVIAASASLVACNSENTESTNVRTAGIWASMEVDSNGSRSRVNVELNVGGSNGTNLVLSDNEYLEVRVAGQTQRPSEDTDFFDIDYQAYIDIVDSNSVFNIIFYRDDGEIISGSSATLPAEYSIIEPQAGAIFSLDDTMTVTWDAAPQEGTISLSATQTCALAAGGTRSETLISNGGIQDDGMYVVSLADQSVFSGGLAEYNRNTLCDVTLTMTRENRGTADASFESGSRFVTLQTREVEFQLDLSGD